MSGRNRGPPHGGMPPIHEPPFGRNLGGPMPHPALLEEMREAQFQMAAHHRQAPPHPGIFEERLAVQHQDIQALLVDNQRLAATHVALKQELEAAQHELQQTDHFAKKILMEKDMQLRGLFEKSAKMEHDLHGVEGMRAELMQVHADVKELTAMRQKLTAQVQAMTQDLGRANVDLKQVPALKSEIGGLRQELQHARAAIEHEKKGHAENYEHGQVMEKNLLTMARELEKLRAEMANTEKRARAAAAAAAANPNPGYNPSYGNPEALANYAGNPYPEANYAGNPYPEANYAGNPYPDANYAGNPYPDANYAGNPYPANYGMGSANQMNPVQPGVEAYPQYAPGPGAWGTYDMQRAQGHR